jgi:hypothetical protein
MGRRLTAPSLNREDARVLMKVCIFCGGHWTVLSHPIESQTAPYRLPLRAIYAPARPLQRVIPTRSDPPRCPARTPSRSPALHHRKRGLTAPEIASVRSGSSHRLSAHP